MTNRLPALAAVLLACALPAHGQTVHNSTFDADLSGWTVTNTPDGTGAPGTVEPVDADGPGPLGASPAAAFAVGLARGTPMEDFGGVLMTQTVELDAGLEYTVRLDWAVINEGAASQSQGGEFRIVVEGNTFVIDQAGPVTAGTTKTGTLAMTFTAAATGPAELGIRITRRFFVPGGSQPTLRQLVDNVRLETGLSGTPDFISLAGGGAQTLNLDAGPGRAGWAYWVFGSATGPQPGLDFPGDVHLPLVPDPYFDLTLTQPFGGPFGSFVGLLDGNGRATATLTLTPGTDPALSGVTLYHAYLAAAALGDVDFGSSVDAVLLF